MKPITRFRAIVKLVIANLSWLLEEESSTILPTKRYIQLGRRRLKAKTFLTKELKGLLCKPAEWRTEAEKDLIYKIIGGFKCFRKYPENTKMLLAGCSYFVYYGVNRTIVRQHHYAEAMYFLIRGQVSMSVLIYDGVLQQHVNTEIGILNAGEMFGDTALLHNLPRTSTIVSTAPVEFLILKREDFTHIIRDTVQRAWDFTINSMNLNPYFDDWDETTKRECCVLGKTQTFKMNETILGDGEGLTQYVYFVITGQCKLIEHLIFEKDQKKYSTQKYKMYEVQKEPNIDKKDSIFTFQMKSRSSRSCFKKPSYKSLESDKTNSSSTTDEIQDLYKFKQRTSDCKGSISWPLPKNTETYFMEVSTIREQGFFGLGENMERRRVVAATSVVCLLIPRYFIVQRWSKNKLNNAILLLEKNIPNTQDLVFEFIEQRKWKKYREDLFKSLVKKPPCNSIHNVPYSIRIRNEKY